MSNTWGNRITLSIFGESHGEAIGIVIGGLPAGEGINEEEIAADMARRAPGNNEFSTKRKEPDKAEIVSGLYREKTTGAPLCGMIRNTDTRSSDYDATVPRPSHADYAAYVKYGGNSDPRGGGHFSGRLTAPIVFAGNIAKQILKKEGIVFGAHILQIGSARDSMFGEVTPYLLNELIKSDFPVIDPNAAHLMKEEILNAKNEGDSVGGIVECAAAGLPAGLGEPFFGSVESVIASLMYSVPAVKGISFGEGFGFAAMKGSQANDPLRMNEGNIVMSSNHNGGINGGITNGMPIVCSVAFKPTPSIAKEQNSVNLQTGQNETLTVRGRHDPCIVPRAVVVTEAVLALSVLDLWMQR